MQITLTLHRIYQKGYLCFEVPESEELKLQLCNLLSICQKKNNDFVSVTLKRPYTPRTTGSHSQNHHLNGHIMQICNETGNDYETVKKCIKMIAVEQFGYPYTDITGHILPKRESDCDTEECAKLIEASHYLAAALGLVLREEAE